MVKRNVKLEKPSQKQKQTQIVNIHLGSKVKKSKKGKSKPKKKSKVERREGAPPLTAFNPPPIINFPPGFMGTNQPNYFNKPIPPPPLKETAAFPEGETAGVLNLNPSVPVPFSFIGAEERLKAPAREPKLTEEVKVKEEVILPIEQPEAIGGEELARALAEAEALATLPEEPITFLEPAKAEAKPEGVKEEKKKKSTGLARFFSVAPSGVNLATGLPHNFPPEEKRTFSLEAEAKKKGRPAGSKNKPKAVEEEEAPLFSIFPITENVNPLSIPLQTAIKEDEPFKYSAPLSQLGGQYEFIGQPKPPSEKEVSGLERRRTGVAITPSEESIIGGTPPFLLPPVFLG